MKPKRTSWSATIRFAPDVEQEFSWQTKANGGHAENAETGTTREHSSLKVGRNNPNLESSTIPL
jgi:hypothetical protein